MRRDELLKVVKRGWLGKEFRGIAIRQDVCKAGRISYRATMPAKMHAY